MKRPDPETEKIMEHLYPGEKSAKKYQEFQMKKYKIMLLIIIFGIAATVCMHLSSRMQSRLVEGTRLFRNEWGEGIYSVVLKGISGEKEGEILYEVKERLFTEEEILHLKEQMLSELPERITGDNESLMKVDRDLELITGMEGYPFTIVWQSSDHDRIRTDGKVNTANLPQEGEEVILTAVCSYEGKSWEQEIPVKLAPRVLSPTEQYLAAMQEELYENDMLYRKDHEILLPEKIGKEAVKWEEKKADNSFLLLIISFFAAALVSFFMNRELKQKEKLRSEELIRDYPEFISRLQLYMGAGLTVKNSFLRMGKEYREEKERTGKRKFLYEEILISGYEFLNGRPETEVYREWGKRCGEMKYRKLSFLLISHLRQGNDKILSILSEETDMALEEKKNVAKKAGEEAGTRLLLPMMMMLIVVMCLILLPAFSGFGTA